MSTNPGCASGAYFDHLAMAHLLLKRDELIISVQAASALPAYPMLGRINGPRRWEGDDS